MTLISYTDKKQQFAIQFQIVRKKGQPWDKLVCLDSKQKTINERNFNLKRFKLSLISLQFSETLQSAFLTTVRITTQSQPEAMEQQPPAALITHSYHSVY